jgi:23S rRNA (adenine2503-C2)-methyltransferase
MKQVHHSNLDASVNIVEEKLVGFLESRFVQKTQDYFICYLSSQTGCNKGCRFCHLTATKQTKFVDATVDDFANQALQVFKQYIEVVKTQPKAKYVHFNFMARGEPLANSLILENSPELLAGLGLIARITQKDLGVKFNISTIMPKSLDKSLQEVFPMIHPTIYYSLYSVNEKFRKKWLPQAMDFWDALESLRVYQEFSKKLVKIHYCFIEGENDSEEDVQAMCDAVNGMHLNWEFNLVRYNPFSEIQGRESSEEVLERNLSIIRANNLNKVQMIPRVGFDVKASCGMFVEK